MIKINRQANAVFAIRKYVILLGLFVELALNGQTILTYSYTGSVQTFTVPSCVTTISLEAKGSRGGTNAGVVLGGPGGSAYGVLTVTPGNVLYIYVGATNGYNGGGLAGTSPCTAAIGGIGGGASDVRLNGTTLANRVIVGGGGGGAGGNRIPTCGRGTGGGGGGGYYGGGGGAGWPGVPPGGPVPTGGTQMNGGSAGVSTFIPANSAQAGSLAIGGNGGSEIASLQGTPMYIGLTGGAGGGLNGMPGNYSNGIPGPGGGEGGTGNWTGQSGAGGSSYFGSLANGTTIVGNSLANGLVTISFTSNAGIISAVASPSSICYGSSSTLSASGLNTYTWSTNITSSSIVVTPTLTSTYTVVGTNSLACTSTAVVTINVDGSPPVISVLSNTNPICSGSSTTLTALGAGSFSWSGGITNGIPFSPTATSVYTVAGTNGCGTATALATVSVIPSPTITTNLSNTVICSGVPLVLSASGANSYTWTGGITNGITFTPSTTTSYTVTGSNTLGCTSSAVANVTISAFAGSNATIIPINAGVCVGSSITLTALGLTTYTWDSGSNSNAISVSPTVNTSYSVQGTNASGCISNAIITVTVNVLTPSILIVPSSNSVCPGNTVVLTASGASSYTWSGGVSNGVFFAPASTTGYTVNASNACGTTSASINIIVNANPTVTASASTPSVCSGNSVTLSGNGALSYTWTGGIQNGLAFTPALSDSYTVTGTNGFGCTGFAVTSVTVYPTPSVNPIASQNTICVGASVNLTTSGATSYTWYPGGLLSAVVSVTPGSTTTYTLIQANANCVGTKTITVNVNPLPTIMAFAQPSLVCAGNSATLTAGGANSYTWTPSLFNLVGTTVVVNPTSTTIYTVTGAIGDCVGSNTLLLGTQANPTLSTISTASSICIGESVTITASGASSYTWSPGGLNGSVIVVSPTIPTSYVVSGTNSLNCIAQTSQIVLVYSNPLINVVSNNSLVCSGGASTLSASGASTYSWSTGAVGAVTVVNPTTSTVYTLTGIQNPGGCSDTKTISVQTFNPVSIINGPGSVCIGSSITLSAGMANTYTWSTAGNVISNSISVVISPLVNTTYSLSTSSTSNNVTCSGTNSINIIVNPLPIVTASTTRSLICRGFEFATLNANGALTYSWVGVGAGTNVTVSPQSQTTYTVQGTDGNGCMSIATIVIKVSACTVINETKEEAQKIISVFPNPSNGEFTVMSEQQLTLRLVNELGQVITEISLSENNSYRANIKNLASGIYFIIGKTNQLIVNQKVIIQQ